MDNRLVIAECHADTMFTKMLCENYNVRVDHSAGKHELAKQMEKFTQTHSNVICLGIIDNDRQNIKQKKTHPQYFKNFELVESKKDLFFRTYEEEASRCFVIEIFPAFEKWILNASKSAGINPEEYKLPDNVRDLIKKTKSAEVKNMSNFWNFLNDIVHSSSPHIKAIRSFIDKSFSSTI